MTLEQKLDVILRHMVLRFQLGEVVDKKHKAVKEQDFQSAVKLLEEERVLDAKYTENGKQLVELLNVIQNLETSVATKAK